MTQKDERQANALTPLVFCCISGNTEVINKQLWNEQNRFTQVYSILATYNFEPLVLYYFHFYVTLNTTFKRERVYFVRFNTPHVLARHSYFAVHDLLDIYEVLQ